MKRNHRSVLLNRQRGTVVLPVALRFDGPIGMELRAGLRRIGAEIRRTCSLVATRYALRRLGREQLRANRDIEWQRNELLQAERNLVWLELEYTKERDRLLTRLQELMGSAS